MKRVVAYLNCCCIGLYLLTGLFPMLSTAMAQDAMPDLTPVVVNANKGSVEIRNIGHAVAKPSRVFVVCSVRDAGKTKPCAEGLHLPGFIKKWNTLPFDIPALQAGAIHRIRVFGAGAFPHTQGLHGMNIIVDPMKKVAESNESNNFTRLEIAIKEKEPSLSKTLDKIPDLVPLIANADQGIVRIQNNGTAPAPASTLVASCKAYDSRGAFMHACTARTYLPNFDANRLLLSYDIPALKPGQSHEVHLFGSDAWPDRPGRYHLELVADFDKQVAEISEANNSTSFTSLHAANDSEKGTTGRSPRPDLVAVANDPFFGIIYVENQGDATAGESKLLMSCHQTGQNGGCATSPAMERIYDFTLGGFVMNVPAIPAGQVHRVLFPAQYLNWDKGSYAFSLTADATRLVAEASEKNNIVHRTLRWDTGVLRIIASNDGKPAPVNYYIAPSGVRSSVPFHAAGKSALGIQTPVDISLPTGVYRLGIQPANSHGVERRFDIEIKAGKVLAQRIAFQQPGFLKLLVLDDHHEKLSYLSYSIHTSGRKYDTASIGGGTSPFRVKLLPGNYDVRLLRNLTLTNSSHKSSLDIRRILGPRAEKLVAGVHIQSGQTTEKEVIFPHITPGELHVRVFVDGQLVRFHMNISDSQGHPVLSSFPARFDSPTRLRLAAGHYMLNVYPEDEGNAFQGHGYGMRNITIDIKAGETAAKTVKFQTSEKGRLALSVLVDGSRSKAEIGIRNAGRKGGFSAVKATYNLLTNKADLLPGRYDISIRPLEFHLTPGGVDVFHGGTSGPGIQTRRVHAVDPVILHDIQIKSNQTLEKTVRFEAGK